MQPQPLQNHISCNAELDPNDIVPLKHNSDDPEKSNLNLSHPISKSSQMSKVVMPALHPLLATHKFDACRFTTSLSAELTHLFTSLALQLQQSVHSLTQGPTSPVQTSKLCHTITNHTVFVPMQSLIGWCHWKIWQ